MIKHSITGSTIQIETDALRAEIHTEGYVSGVAGGTLHDKKSGARDLGHGLSIVDFLLEPAPAGERPAEGQYQFGAGAMLRFHGRIPKRYVEGPQICTKAGKAPFRNYPGRAVPGHPAVVHVASGLSSASRRGRAGSRFSYFPRTLDTFSARIA